MKFLKYVWNSDKIGYFIMILTFSLMIGILTYCIIKTFNHGT